MTPAATEPRDTAIRRLRMRSMRRGMREMDLILTDFAETALDGMTAEDLVRYDALLEEPDGEILGWLTGRDTPPERHRALVCDIAARLGRPGGTGVRGA